MQKIYEDQDCLISYEAGEADHCIISFSGLRYGVGLTHWSAGEKPVLLYDNPDDEFRNTLNSFARIPHAFYVTDKGQCWYNNTSSQTIPDVLSKEIDRHGFTSVVTIGNSAGGFGAIVFSPLLPRVCRVVAFGPQSSIHPDFAPFEDRWPEYRKRVHEWKIIDAVPFITQIEYVVLFGEDHRDKLHAERLAGCRPILIPGAGHAIAKFLRSRKILYRLAEHLFDPFAPLSLEEHLETLGVNSKS